MPSPTSSIDEKPAADYKEDITSESLSSTDGMSDEERAADKALVRKIDWRLIPFCSLLYLLSFLDRTAIGNAKLYGLTTSLRLSDEEYLISLTVFFFTYSIFEVPSNVFLKRLRPSIWIPSIMVAWGVVMLCTGFVDNFTGLWVTRVLLGATEAGLYPGINYFLSSWYKRSEFGLRAAVFFSAATISGAFGGLLAAGIGSGITVNIGALSGSWRWIFILEGVATVVVALVAFWFLADFPRDAKFLTEEERERTINRLLADDRYDAGNTGTDTWGPARAALADWTTVLNQCLMFMSPLGALYSFALFTPSIIAGLGYNGTTANLLSVPIYVWAGFLTVAVGFAADRQVVKNRTLFNIIGLSVGATGYLILTVSRNNSLSYFALFIAASGIYPLVPNTIAIVAANVEGDMKRGIVLGAVISFGNMNGAVSSNLYRSNQKPWYTLGHAVVLGYLVMGIVVNTVYRITMKRENDARDRGEREEAIGGEPLALGESREGKGGKNGWYATIQDAQIAKGDRYSGFRYSL